MSRSMKYLFGAPLEATDGEAGTVQEMFFDDVEWKIHYLGVHLGVSVDVPEVIIPLERIAGVSEYGFAAYLTIDEVAACAGIDMAPSVSRLHEQELLRLFGSRAYARHIGNTEDTGSIVSPPPPRQEGILKSAARNEEKATRDDRRFNTHLRRSREVLRYSIRTQQGRVGAIEDFLFDPHTWHIEALTVATNGLFSHRRATIETSVVKEICWIDSCIVVSLSAEEIRHRSR